MRATREWMLTCWAVGALSLAARGTEVAWVPVGADGPHSIVGNEIVLQGAGQFVTLEIRISAWDPDLDNDPKVGTYQVTVDSTGYASGAGDPLVPFEDPDPLAGAYQNIKRCHEFVGGYFVPTDNRCDQPLECPGGEFCFDNPYFIFKGILSQAAISTSTANYAWGATTNPGQCKSDGGTCSSTVDGVCTVDSDCAAYPNEECIWSYYAGTLILEVPATAAGAYTIGFDPNESNTFLNNCAGIRMDQPDFVPVVITIACATDEDCDDSNECTDDVCEPDNTCSNTPNYDDTVYCCDPAVGPPAGLTELDDGNPCTVGVCDPEDGSVTQEPLAEGTLCGNPPGGECDAQDTCDGAGTCIDRVAPEGTACGDPGDTECDNPDTCDDAGVCQSNREPAGTACGDPTDTECDWADTCDGTGSCLDNIQPSGTACGEPGDTECDDPDTCDGAGTCQTNVEPAGVQCGSQVGDQCDDPDSCDGAGNCLPNYVPPGTACGDPSSSECDNPDQCNGAGVCDVNHVANGTPCTDDGNECRNDVCQGGICAHPLKPVGSPCGDPTDTECDNPDSCDGTGTCQDNLEPPGAACGDPVATDCDAADTCDGSGTCLANIVPAGTACGDPTDTDCDDPDTCDGAGACLPNVAPAGLLCGNQVGNQCDEPDTCDGAGVCEPNYVPAGTACGSPVDTHCDNPDSCDGAGVCDPNREPDGTPCPDDGNDCREDYCLAGVCSHPLKPPGSACGDPADTDCDDPDTCDGTGSCLLNLAPGGTACGDPEDTICTDPDTCDGFGGCLPNHAPNGTDCDVGLFCFSGATCQDGVCGGGSPIDCSDGLDCTEDTCNEVEGRCDHELLPGYCLIDDACYDDAELNPDNDCEICDIAEYTTEWTLMPEGTPCDDGDPCTGTGEPGIGIDTCDAEGVCSGTVDPNCNDDCINAVEVFDGTNIGNNDDRGPDDAEAGCQPDSNNDVWFYYVATCTGTVVMDTNGSDFAPWNDTVLSVYDSCGGTELACDDDDGLGLLSLLDFSADEESTYYIRVAGFHDNSGDIVLNIATADGCVIDGLCYMEGELNPENECEECFPFLSSTDWSPRAQGSPCGDAGESECDSGDSCDGAGACEVNHKADGELCSDDGNDCTQDICLTGVCSHPPESAGTPCGDDTATECDNPDTCNGAGVCLDNFAPAGLPCGDPSTTECDNADICDGLGACDPNHQADGVACSDDGVECTFDECGGGECIHPPRPAGTACGDGSNTQCDNPDTCDGTGICLDNYEPSGFACGDPTDTECDNPDTCDGLGACQVNFEPVGFACGDPTDTDCDNPDTCNGAGACQDNFEISGFPCGDPSNTQCDKPDTCDGVGVCLDNFEPPGVSCGDPSADECDNADICDGLGECDPNHQPDGLPCSDEGNECTFDECGGGECIHPPKVAGFPCGDPANTQCDNPDTCDGDGVCLDNYEPDGFTCGDPTDTDCDNPDTCDGAGVCLDNYEPDGFACGDPTNTDCDNPDTCDGAGTCLDNYEINGFPCGDPNNTQCDNPDTCDGVGICLDNFEPQGLACGDPSSDQCDNGDVCDGLGECDPNHVANGTPCDDEDICTGDDACLDGECVGTLIPEPPLVSPEGPRWIGITPLPPGSVAPVALHVTSPTLPCVDNYLGGVYRCNGAGDRCATAADCNACSLSGKPCLIDADCPFPEETCIVSGQACVPGTIEPIDVNRDGFMDGTEAALVDDPADKVVLVPDDWTTAVTRCSRSVTPCTVDADCDWGICSHPLCSDGTCDEVLGPCSVAAQGCPSYCVIAYTGCESDLDCPIPGDTCIFPTCELDEACVGGKVYVTGAKIAPDSTYEVVAECDGHEAAPGSGQTYSWCDVNGDGTANFADIQLQVQGFQGGLSLVTYLAVDTEPCAPNGVINFADIQWCVIAWQAEEPYSTFCGGPCD